MFLLSASKLTSASGVLQYQQGRNDPLQNVIPSMREECLLPPDAPDADVYRLFVSNRFEGGKTTIASIWQTSSNWIFEACEVLAVDDESLRFRNFAGEQHVPWTDIKEILVR